MLAEKMEGMLVVEMNTGQMLDDVMLATEWPGTGRILRPHGRGIHVPG